MSESGLHRVIHVTHDISLKSDRSSLTVPAEINGIVNPTAMLSAPSTAMPFLRMDLRDDLLHDLPVDGGGPLRAALNRYVSFR